MKVYKAGYLTGHISVLFLIPLFKAPPNLVLKCCPVALSVGRLWQVLERNQLGIIEHEGSPCSPQLSTSESMPIISKVFIWKDAERLFLC